MADPTLYAKLVRGPQNVMLFRTDPCPYCQKRHIHGAGRVGEVPDEGHRIGHCVGGPRGNYFVRIGYPFRICERGPVLQWDDMISTIIDQLAAGDLRFPKRAYRYAAARRFAQLNGWDLLTVDPTPLSYPPEVSDFYRLQDGRKAAVIHTPTPISQTEVINATLDRLPASWYEPCSMHAYVIRDDLPPHHYRHRQHPRRNQPMTGRLNPHK